METFFPLYHTSTNIVFLILQIQNKKAGRNIFFTETWPIFFSNTYTIAKAYKPNRDLPEP